LKVLKFLFIFLFCLFIVVGGFYSSIPLIIKSYLPDYICTYTPISKINFQKIYYSSFSKLNIDNIELKLNKKDTNLDVIIPKIIINFNISSIQNQFPQIDIVHPIILGRLDIDTFVRKDSSSEPDLTSRNKFKPGLLSKILKILYINERGNILFNYVKFNKFKASGFKAEFNYQNGRLNIYNIDSKIFDGRIKGNILIELDENNVVYNSQFNLKNIDSYNLVNLMDTNKFRLSGVYTGEVFLKGSGCNIKNLSGNLTSIGEGGRININIDEFNDFLKQKDAKFKLAVEQLENLVYNKGMIEIKTSDDDLFIRAIFEGKDGKKDIEFIFHDIFGGEEWFIKFLR